MKNITNKKEWLLSLREIPERWSTGLTIIPLVLWVVLIPLILWLLAGCVSSPTSDDLEELRQVTVRIDVGDSGTCSGVLVAPEQVITAAHCIPPDLKILKVRGMDAGAMVKNDDADMAVLSVPGLGCPCATLATVRPSVDTLLVIVGYPLNFAQYLTEGRLQGAITDPQAPENIRAHFMAMSVSIAFGNSGGPVFAWIDGAYRVVGIVSKVRGADFYGPVWHLSIAVNTETMLEFFGKHGV